MSSLISLIILIFVALSSAVTNNLIVYKNEVSPEMEAHIVSYTLALIANQTDINTIQTQLVNEMNGKYGARWLVHTTTNQIEITDSYIAPQPNSLYWFAFHGQNFYLIKPLLLNQTLHTSSAQLKNFTELVLNARNSEIEVIFKDNVYDSTLELFNTQIRAALNSTDICVAGETLNKNGDTCFEQLAKIIQSKIIGIHWIVFVAEKHSAGVYRQYSFQKYSVTVGDLCAATNNLIVYKNEVSAEMEAHIVSYTLALIANQTDINTIQTQLVNEMNGKYGPKWLAYTGLNQIDVANTYFTPQPNSLYWFSFHGQNFYLIKPLPAVNQTSHSSTQQKNYTSMVINARNSDIKVLMNVSFTEQETRQINEQILYQLNATDTCVSDESSVGHGNSCFAKLAKNIQKKIVSGGFYVTVVGEKQSAAAYRDYSFAQYSVLVGDLWFYFDYRS